MTKAERLELQKTKLIEMRSREDDLHARGVRFVAGIDEVGRGPLAGPVYAAAVVLPEGCGILGINDSKKLTAAKREELSELIKAQALAYGIGIADNREIDELNILNATKLAMKRAIDACSRQLADSQLETVDEPAAAGVHAATDAQEPARIEQLMIDAVKLEVDIPQESIIKGDEKCLCIAAASIVAKVARDSYMEELDEVYPGYDFASNKGYGTAAHYAGLRELGYTPIHRRSFLRKFEEEDSAWSDSRAHSNNAGASQPAQTSPNTDICSADKDAINMAKKVYAVKKGRETGIFTDWDTCRKQVDGFAGAEYKGFADPQDALAYLGLAGGPSGTGVGSQLAPGVHAYVDGSFDAGSGRFSCGVVIVTADASGRIDTTELSSAFDDEAAAEQRNVAGEIMGARMAIEYCLEHGIDSVTVYHDYEGVGKWADNLWKANNPLTQGYKSYVAGARQQMKITFVKVKAHAGNKYNELADKLAKGALE